VSGVVPRARGGVLARVGVRACRDDGFTLVETLVSMVVFAVVIGLTVSVLITVSQQTRDNLARSDSVESARIGLSQIDRLVRSGNLLYDPVASGGMNVSVFTQANGERQCVEWRVQTDGQLRTRSWSPAWQTDGEISAWATYARDLVNNAPGYTATPAFTLTTTGHDSQSVLNVRLLVKSPDSKGTPVEVMTTLSGRNTLFGYDPAVCQNVPPT
jgi:prepilin-type N-terminal cleavage/methylation domain-containing protein